MQLAQVGKYKVLAKLGQGAMGEVFRAHDPVLGRDVAVKLLTEKLSGDDAARQRFQREARSAAQLNHPNIITVHDFGEEHGMAYMAMELLEGTDLRELIEKKRLDSLERKLAILEQILEGLAFAHSKGVFHRDLKPGNIHVLPNGQVKIMDFGLARRAQDAAATAVVMGTPYYMAPEQAEGEPPTARSDIFSLGALTYELLAGKRPFTGGTIAAVLFAVVRKDPEPLTQVAPDVPAVLEPFVLKALSKKPQNRYADAAEMLEALRTLLAGGEGPEYDGAAAGPLEDESPERPLGAPLSARRETPAELRAAIEEIDDYLADRIPPLMVADSVATLQTTAPAEGTAAEIWFWAGRQLAADPGILPLADILYHALYRLSFVGLLNLLDKAKLVAYLRGVGELLAAACPPQERDRLRRALVHLGEEDLVRANPLDMMRQLAAPSMSHAATPGLKRLSLLEHRLRVGLLSKSASAKAHHRRVASQALAVAAAEAKNEAELGDHLRRLQKAGAPGAPEQVMRSLGKELAEWALPKSLAPDTTDVGVAAEVEAMRKIVALAEDPIELASRYRHLVNAAIEQFNQGNLGGSVQMFGLAQKLVAENKISANHIEPLQKRGQEALDAGRLKQYMEAPDRHPPLQEVLSFFNPSLGASVLLDQLESEERRDKRRLLLDLLAVHGPAARALARTRLLASLRSTVPDFARRNWVYLLRTVPRPAEEAADPEIDAVCRFASPSCAPFLAKEALLYLGQTRHARAALGLANLLRSWEQHLERTPDGLREEGQSTLDRLAAALAKQASPKTWLPLVEHALAQKPAHGATMARLAELGSQDLSSCPEVVEILCDEIEASLPRGVLSRLVGRKDQDLPVLVAALGGTRTPEVRALLEEVIERSTSKDAGRAAARALQPPAAPAPTGQSGDLDPFGLPVLLQRLMEARSNGILTLMPGAGEGAPATISLAQGRIVAARWLHRSGLDAFCQMFERPIEGKYAFDPGARPTAGPVLGELSTLVREGISRARALRRTSAIVPDDAQLEATGAAPGTVADEPEYELVVSLWEKACAGVAAARLEAELATDAFRIYRPLAQWLEEGALRVLPSAEAIAAAKAATAAATEAAASASDGATQASASAGN